MPALPVSWTMKDFLKFVAVLLIGYLLVLLLVLFYQIMAGPDPEGGLMELAELFISGKVIAGLLTVGAGVRFGSEISGLLERIG